GTDGGRPKPIWLRVGVGVERRSRLAQRPPAGGYVLVRLRLLHDPSRAVGNATGMARCREAREARHREIESAPVKLDRAGFADECGLEDLEHAVDLDQRPPEQLRVVRVIRRMALVLIER